VEYLKLLQKQLEEMWLRQSFGSKDRTPSLKENAIVFDENVRWWTRRTSKETLPRDLLGNRNYGVDEKFDDNMNEHT